MSKYIYIIDPFGNEQLHVFGPLNKNWKKLVRKFQVSWIRV